ncbi:MAG: ABC transporter substrate-binding protein, partial [Oscillospiraceae bacterium]|nr:ABC transporter substrate-binding protein [Oscillospiraceae bacterium]
MKKFFAMLLAATMLLALSACGGKSDSTQTPAEPTQTESAPAEAAPAAAEPAADAAQLNTVNAGKLTMSTNAEFPPYESTDDAGQFIGIDVEIAQA